MSAWQSMCFLLLVFLIVDSDAWVRVERGKTERSSRRQGIDQPAVVTYLSVAIADDRLFAMEVEVEEEGWISVQNSADE